MVGLARPGRELIDEAFTAHMRDERHLLDLLTPAEAGSLETVLTTWLSRMERPGPAAASDPSIPGADRPSGTDRVTPPHRPTARAAGQG